MDCRAGRIGAPCLRYFGQGWKLSGWPGSRWGGSWKLESETSGLSARLPQWTPRSRSTRHTFTRRQEIRPCFGFFLRHNGDCLEWAPEHLWSTIASSYIYRWNICRASGADPCYSAWQSLDQLIAIRYSLFLPLRHRGRAGQFVCAVWRSH